MKKVFLTAVAVFGFAFANAQEVKYGAKAGLNLSNFAGDAEGNSAKVGFQIGGFAEIKISDKFAIQPELLFSAQGAKEKESYKESGITVTSEDIIKLNYLNIPIMAKYYATEKLYIEAGPQIGLLMSAKSEFKETETFGGLTETISGSADVKKYFNSTDFGLNVGFGYIFTENIGAGVRYTSGLSNIGKDAPSDFKVTNSNIAVSVSYNF
jgi:hypothetical protein